MKLDHFVPVIDYTKPDHQVAEELYSALSTVGFACLTGTGLWQQVCFIYHFPRILLHWEFPSIRAKFFLMFDFFYSILIF